MLFVQYNLPVVLCKANKTKGVLSIRSENTELWGVKKTLDYMTIADISKIYAEIRFLWKNAASRKQAICKTCVL